jgi:glycosyltransferase involved in cell wall biosynthesis
VHLIHTVAHGGVETILINWLTHLDRSRIDARLVVFANPGSTEKAFVDAAARAGLPVRSIPWAKRKPVILATKKLVEILREDGIDIVHAHNLYAEVVGYLAARIVGCKVLTTQYVWADFGWKRNVMQAIAARVIRRFDLVTSQCEETMRETARRGVPPGIQRVLISGIEPCTDWVSPSDRAVEREKLGVRPDEVVLVNVARLYPEKAQALLLKMFRTILDRRPNARLWIMGVGPLEAELRALAGELSFGEAVRFVGFVPKPARFLQLTDIQVHPSYAEGVPLALCEGMAAGMPILATAVGGVPEIIQTDKSGLLVPARDEHAFIEQCIRLIDDPALRARLSRGARTFIETQYTLDVAASHLVATYEDLVR